VKPITVTVDIDRPPAEVFAFLSDFENNPRFQRGMRRCTWTSPAPHGVGSTYDQVAHFLGKDIVSSFEVVEWEPGRRVKIASTSGPFPIQETRIVEPRDGGARVTAVVEGDASGFFRLAAPLQRFMVERSVRRDYQRDLERLLESSGDG
jgi:uncharacterized protein YndB with AHSA1/START domain